MNPIIWVIVVIFVIIALYYKFVIERKIDCVITIFEKRGDYLVRHKKEYGARFRKATNPETGKTVRWLNIKGIKRDWLVPDSKEFIQVTQGKRRLILAWYGGNNFQVMKPKIGNFVYVKAGKLKKGGFYYKKVKQDNISLDIVPEDMKFAVYQLDNSLEMIYKRKANLWENLKPYYTISAIVLVAIIAMYITSKQNKEAGADNLSAGRYIANAIAGQSEKQIDENTVAKTTPSKSTGGG